MTTIHKAIKKGVPKEWMKAHPIQKKVNDEGVSTRESLSRRMSPEMPPEEPAMPIADEEEIKRSKRRTASSRGGGRASTIFTDSDRLGP